MSGICEYCGSADFNGTMGPSGQYNQHNPSECRDRLRSMLQRVISQVEAVDEEMSGLTNSPNPSVYPVVCENCDTLLYNLDEAWAHQCS
jgi:hypothetical protein